MIVGQHVRVTTPGIRIRWIGTVIRIDGDHVWLNCGAAGATVMSVPVAWCEVLAPNTVNVAPGWSPAQHVKEAS